MKRHESAREECGRGPERSRWTADVGAGLCGWKRLAGGERRASFAGLLSMVVGAIAGLWPSVALGQCGGMQDLGTLVGGAWSRANTVSADGRTVVGYASNAAGQGRPFRWTAAGGMQDLGTLFAGETSNEALAVCMDGSVVVGHCVNSAIESRAFRWTLAGGMQDLGTLGGSGAKPSAVSADGAVVVGFAYNSNDQLRAFRWTLAGGMQDLGTLGGGGSMARAVSADGGTVVGWSTNAANKDGAFRWTAAGGMRDLGTLGGESWTRSTAVSADGSVVVGNSVNAANQTRAFRWTLAGGMQDLGTLGGDRPNAIAVSADGAVVVGEVSIAGNDHAFRWTAAGGMQDLGTLGGTYSRAYAVSADGAVVAGYAYNADNQPRAFRWMRDSGMQDLGTLGVQSSEALALSSDGNVVVGNSGNSAGQLRAFRWGDADGDGLPDDWECNGIPYTDGAGQTQRYMLPGANWLRKDLYVEVDAMDGRAPAQDAIDRVVAAFNRAPVPAPTGVEGGQPGIALHAVIDETNLPRRPYPGGFVEFQQDKAVYFGTAAERGSPDWAAIREARRKAYRYCIFGQSHSGSDSSGLAEPGGNDFMVTLGLWTTPGGTVQQQAGTFMHELGHTLGLWHGGDQSANRFNYKPNYFSIMNYLWQSPKPWLPEGNGPGQWEAYFPDYSDRVLPTLNEAALSEAVGIGGNIPGVRVPYSIPAGVINPDTHQPCMALPSAPCTRYAGFTGSVDWDSDGAIGPVAGTLDINYVRPGAGPSPGDALTGFNDWENLKYNFRGSPAFGEGVIVTDAPVEMDLATEQYLGSLPPPPPLPGACLADIVGIGGLPPPDGLLTGDDFNAFINAFAAGDSLADIVAIGGLPPPDGLTTGDDFNAFINGFAQGCP